MHLKKLFLFFSFFLFVFINIGFYFVESPLGNAQKSRGNKEKGIVVATWNIGHFANGQEPNSLIGPEQYNSKLKAFRTMIYDSISADLVGICEYSSVFGKDKNGRDMLSSNILFNKYANKNEGAKSWICNSFFYNIKLENIEKLFFNCSKTFVHKDPRVALFHYVSADTYIDGERVKVVLVHLVSSQPNLCQLQIEELINKYKIYNKVIMFGDWNTWNWTKFREEGFCLANDGSLITFPSKKYALDNIIDKGLRISEVRVIKTDLSDHYPLVCRISLKD